MAELSEDDIKFVLSVDPDDDALNKAIQQINADIEAAEVKKIRMELEAPSAMEKFGGGLRQTGAGAVGAVGAAVGGAADVADQVLSGVGKLAAAPFKIVATGLNSITKVLHDIQGPLGPVGAGLSVVSDGMGALAVGVGKIPILGKLLAPVVGAFAGIPNALKGTLEAMTGLTAKADPGSVRMLGIAVEDFQATVGQSFTPVVQMMSDMTRTFSTLVANLLPNAAETEKAMSGLRAVWGEFSDYLTELVAEFGPTIREGIIGGIENMVDVLSDAARAVWEYVPSFEQIKESWFTVKEVLVSAWQETSRVLKEFVNGLREAADTLSKIGGYVRKAFEYGTPVGWAVKGVGAWNSWARGKRNQGAGGEDEGPALGDSEGDWGGPGDVWSDQGSGKAGDWGSRSRGATLPRSSIAAARTPFMGGIDEYQRRLQMQTAMGPAGVSPESVPRHVSRLAEMLENIEKWFQRMTPEQIMSMVGTGEDKSTWKAITQAEAAAGQEFSWPLR